MRAKHMRPAIEYGWIVSTHDPTYVLRALTIATEKHTISACVRAILRCRCAHTHLAKILQIGHSYPVLNDAPRRSATRKACPCARAGSWLGGMHCKPTANDSVEHDRASLNQCGTRLSRDRAPLPSYTATAISLALKRNVATRIDDACEAHSRAIATSARTRNGRAKT